MTMISIIGNADVSPAIPTSGETIPPAINGSKPRKAEALPAASPCASIASEKDVVEMTPTLETIINKAMAM